MRPSAWQGSGGRDISQGVSAPWRSTATFPATGSCKSEKFGVWPRQQRRCSTPMSKVEATLNLAGLYRPSEKLLGRYVALQDDVKACLAPVSYILRLGRNL